MPFGVAWHGVAWGMFKACVKAALAGSEFISLWCYFWSQLCSQLQGQRGLVSGCRLRWASRRNGKGFWLLEHEPG